VTELRIPQIGTDMVSGSINAWLVDDGATVAVGQPVYLLETDKVEMEIESPVSGRLTQVGAAGQPYEVGRVIGYIEEASEGKGSP
jgi:pyruvate/2-oxoglutarate dehydrogenase complex dihydrolipoamide acyltransferase (E2) component